MKEKVEEEAEKKRNGGRGWNRWSRGGNWKVGEIEGLNESEEIGRIEEEIEKKGEGEEDGIAGKGRCWVGFDASGKVLPSLFKWFNVFVYL